ncbi:ATP-binding protein, partial [Fodinicola feengrottensis]|uniref:ATP-binding protein n=1 Tax=Fodinicola feengrottensis TaxID=435914 RepID=UPI0036F2466D
MHPGYGFLSEDPDFAEMCEAQGLIFIGPPAHVMSRLGDKAQAREVASAAGLPVLPGSSRAVENGLEAKEIAERIGYPVIIKAIAGGGGRGMAVVRAGRELARAYATTRAAAQATFGDGRVYVERFLESTRHVEVQILADHHGNVVSLGERDCSVQRRRQKLIEETPATGLPAGLAENICAAAVRGARACGYVGAGTFEFLVDDKGDFYFIEVNSRIQVEHPVTEMATGIDIVAEQLRVASGSPLSFRQQDVVPRGVALECRVNAEDPDRDFLPTAGLVDPFSCRRAARLPGWTRRPLPAGWAFLPARLPRCSASTLDRSSSCPCRAAGWETGFSGNAVPSCSAGVVIAAGHFSLAAAVRVAYVGLHRGAGNRTFLLG